MKPFKIGVITDSFRLDFASAVKKAAEVGAQGIQPYAVPGSELDYAVLTPARIAELKKIVADQGLCFSALCGDMGKGFADRETNPVQIDKSKRIIDLALELGTAIVTTHVGVIPGDKNAQTYQIMLEAGRQLAEYASSNKASFALETGLESALCMKEYLDQLPKGIAVNFDPANLVMVAGDDPVAGVYTLREYIVHTHAKDGIMLKADQSKEIHPGHEHEHTAAAYKELPLGQGGVPFDAYLDALADIGYKGFLTIEREVGDSPEKDIRLAVEFLKGKLS